jgi:uncharacterized protein YdaU (DUF1376 family)
MAQIKSNKAPAFQFFPRDFISSPKVDRMPMTERGAYITLLCRCWLDNGLPTDLEELAFYCRMKPAQFKRMWENGRIGQCFHERGGKFHNERLDAERQKQKANRQRQSDNAKSGWQRRGTATVMPPHSQHQDSGITRADAPAADADSKQQISSSSLEEKKREPEFDGQKSFMALKAVYPSHRFTDDHPTKVEFNAQVFKDGDPHRSFAEMLDNLDNHKASEEWGRGVIPNVAKWLSTGKWRGRYENKPTTSTNKTAGNMAVYQRFIDRGRAS